MSKWHKLMNAMCAQPPSRWLMQRKEDGWLKEFMPDVNSLFGVPQPSEHHPEVDSGIHTMLVVDQAWKLSNANKNIVWASLLHDLGKIKTPVEEWPKHHGHEEKGLPLVENINKLWVVPEYARVLSTLVCTDHLKAHRSIDMRPGSIIKWLHQSNMLYDKQLLSDFLICCEADARGRTGMENRSYINTDFLKEFVNISSIYLPKGEMLQQIPLQNAISAINKHFQPYCKDSIQKKVNNTSCGFNDTSKLNLLTNGTSLSF